MNDVSSRFGVQLTPTTPQPSMDCSTKDAGGVNRSKASVYAWDDPKLQKTAVVTKKITKAATVVQRFIRACISHWKYYNEERLPLLQDLEDIERRRKEELIEVEEYKKRGYEEAKNELELELSMPQEEFQRCQHEKMELKDAIKEEEELFARYEKEIKDEQQRTKKLKREEHEIEAQHTLSRLDVDIPALEAEKIELTEVQNEFSDIVKALQGQMEELEGNIQMELRHKRRLIRCMAKMIQELQTRGAKQKIISNLKLIIKYKGESPPPKPEPTTTTEPSSDLEGEPKPQRQQQQEEQQIPLNEEKEIKEEIEKAAKLSDDESVPEKSISGIAGNDRQMLPIENSPSDTEQLDINNNAVTDNNASESSFSSITDGQIPGGMAKPSRRGRRRSAAKTAKASGAPAVRSVKKNKSSDSKRSHHDDDDIPAFDWGAGRSTASSRSKSPNRSKSPTSKYSHKKNDRKTSKESDDEDEGGFSWEDMLKIQENKAKKESSNRDDTKKATRRQKSFDGIHKTKEKSAKSHDASFNWEALADESKGKKKNRGGGVGRSKSDLDKVGKEGHFSWAYHASHAKA